MHAHIFGMKCHATTPGVPTPNVSNKHKYARIHTAAWKFTFETVMEITGKNQDNNGSKRKVKGSLQQQNEPGFLPESLGRTSTLQASLVVSEMVEP